MFTLTWQESYYDDETKSADFDTIEELLSFYNEYKWDYCEWEAWKNDKKIAPWYKARQ